MVAIVGVGAVFGLQRGLWEKAFQTGDFCAVASATQGHERAVALLLAGRTADVMKLLEGRDDAVSLRLYGYAACSEGRWARALEAANRLLKACPGDLGAMAIKAEALSALGDRRGAEHLLRKLPAWMSAYVRLRVALHFNDRAAAASAARELRSVTGQTGWVK